MGTADSQDIITRAQAIYDQRLKATLEATEMNRFVVIEPDSGDYFLGDTISEAAAAARKAHPDRRGFIIRVGHKAAVQM